MATQKKVCMVGSFGVGKTSLVRRFVDSIFSEKYHTTVAVTIDRKEVLTSQGSVSLILWDLAGQTADEPIRMSYLRGASGLLLVADSTNNATLQEISVILTRLAPAVADVPKVLLLNKMDLQGDWDLDEALMNRMGEQMIAIPTSAKSGEGVGQAFQTLAERLIHHELDSTRA